MDVLPDIVQFSHGQDAPEQQQKSVTSKGKMDHYLKVLQKFFRTKESAGFMDIVKNNGMLRDNKTMDWFGSSAGGNESAKAMFKMGTMYYSGRGVQIDYGEALEWYLAASEAGVAVAMLKISQMYQYGRGVDQDDKEAMSWYCRAEEALNEQGRLNNHTWFRNNDSGEAAVTSCQIGDMYYLYYFGVDLEQDYSKAMEWFFKASDARDATSMRYIGIMYYNGQGVEQDYRKVKEWFLKAGDAGDATSMRYIGIMYDQGQGAEQDYDMADEWFLKASAAGDATSMRYIGNMYRSGQGVEQDYGIATEWYRKASDAGDATSMRYIGIMYDHGPGAEQDYGMAIEWYRKASDAGDATVCLLSRS
ncbi:hypothetical protein BGZ68_001591 [Mortierella alpina]|nr:hypothetical protein BGZ68_001591 [Mortierella alpina]